MSLIEPPSEPERNRSRLQAILPYTTVALIIAVLYVAWTFYSRHESNRSAEAAIEAKKAEARKEAMERIYGSGAVSFSTFTVDNGTIRRGETTELCYGVVNAESVKIDPPIKAAKPSYHHCIEIAPKKTTTYTITAADGKGNTKTESLTVQVK